MSTKELEGKLLGTPISFAPLHQSIEELSKAAEKINEQKKVSPRISEQTTTTTFFLLRILYHMGCVPQALQSSKWKKNRSLKVRELNDRLMMAERAFKSAEGLPGRPWYKHLVGPPPQSGLLEVAATWPLSIAGRLS